MIIKIYLVRLCWPASKNEMFLDVPWKPSDRRNPLSTWPTSDKKFCLTPEILTCYCGGLSNWTSFLSVALTVYGIPWKSQGTFRSWYKAVPITIDFRNGKPLLPQYPFRFPSRMPVYKIANIPWNLWFEWTKTWFDAVRKFSEWHLSWSCDFGIVWYSLVSPYNPSHSSQNSVLLYAPYISKSNIFRSI